MFITIKACPLCKCKKIKNKLIDNNKNVYSFLISKFLKKKEKYVLKRMKNVVCDNCSLVYKKKWISKKVINYIYNKAMPTHNACLNINSNNFSKKNFTNVLMNYKKSFETKDRENMDKSIREIKKIVNAIPSENINFKRLKKKFFINLENLDLKKNVIKFI